MDRKSAEPIALDAGISPRSLQEFLGSDQWDEKAARNRMAQIVARDHADPGAIGIIDESGHPKKGSHTACVQRQYCGNTGKIGNCAVTVHLAYAAYNRPFRTLPDSTLFLPEHTGTDPERRQTAGIPDDALYRPKHWIALQQINRAVGMLAALGLSLRNRQQRLAAAAKTIQHHQVRIARARRSHIKTRLERLAALDIDLQQLPCCIPPDGYG